mgnify:CR=1 FL=1
MKKILISLALLMVTVPAMAQHWRHGHHGHHGHARHYGHGGWNWMVPAIIGGAVVYSTTRPAETVIVQQQPTVIQPQNQNCSPWTETQHADGSITRTRTCAQ